MRSFAIALGVLITGVPVTATSAPEIVIGPAKLEPQLLQVTTGERVTFVNRSGRPIHVEFRADGGQHHVVQVPGTIWAIFYSPGRHTYVVHPRAGTGQDLHGVIEVEWGEETMTPRECAPTNLLGVCIEP